MNENTFVDSLCFHFYLFFSHCFSILIVLYSKQFRNNYMHCEIIDPYFNIFFIEIQLKKENLKKVFFGR